MSQIVHTVLVEWREGVDPAVADGLVQRRLAGLPGVLTLDHGPSVSAEGLEGGFDWALVIRFADEAALAAYLPHPDHVVVGEHLRTHSSRLVVFDLASSGR